MPKYLHADANLYSHIQTLRAVSVFLALSLLGSLYGWQHAAKVQRISIPPDLRYGNQVALNTIQPWEVYNFAGYIWQQLNRCPHNCITDYPANLNRLTEFLTPRFKAWLKRDGEKRASELLGRTRFILPIENSDFRNTVSLDGAGQWTIVLDVELKENIGGVSVKDAKIRYHLKIIAKSIDPEFNPWGLLLDLMPQAPERITDATS